MEQEPMSASSTTNIFTLVRSTILRRVFGFYEPKLIGVLLGWFAAHPRYFFGAIRLARGIKQSKEAREKASSDGLMAPPFLVLSITRTCNLRCVGCFAAATGTTFNNPQIERKNLVPHLSGDQWRRIIKEASDLGVFGFIVAGGEPFLFPGLVELCKEFEDRFFIILTNGTALTASTYERLKHSTNIVVVVSIEGGKDLTDARRGQGVYSQAIETLERLSAIGVPTGISVSVTHVNCEYWMEQKRLDRLIDQGVHFGLFVEYISDTTHSDVNLSSILRPPDTTISNDQSLLLTHEDRIRFRKRILQYRQTKPLFIIHSPADEEHFGGCVSAGRAFAHITPTGDLTPCPVSNIATHNLVTSSLEDGLRSSLFEEIRKNDHLLEIEDVPCALFAHPKEVEDLVKNVGAYRTDHEYQSSKMKECST